MRQSRDMLYPAPTKGWVQAGNIATASPDQAEVLDNWFPTAQTARLRGGSTVHADIGSASVRQLMVYSGTEDTLFSATDTGIQNATRINLGGAAFDDVAGLTSGDWSAAQMTTSGGRFLVAVNGADFMQFWDGTRWLPVSTVAVNNLGYDALVTAFAVGQVVTGGTSGATATITGITQTSATAGTLRLAAITGGPFQDNEALTSASGAATANGASAAASLAVTITGLATTALSQVWQFKRRLFFVRKDTLSAWYLPVTSIGGALVELPLGSVFRNGGTLLFGAAWSLDSGSGLDDVCVFVSSNGEIAVYEGTDPASVTDWSLRGVYEIARPLNKHAYFKAGGDLAILTEDGIVPLSEALQRDRAALQSIALTAPIEDAWKAAVARRTADFPVSVALWQDQGQLVIGVPGTTSTAFVANAKTGAWCRYTGWDVRCVAVANNALYFGTSTGKVMQGETTGSDNGVQYTASYVPKFSEGGTPQKKSVNYAGLTFKANGTPNFAMKAFADYQAGAAATPEPGTSASGSTWGTGVWGTFSWGSDSSTTTYTKYRAIYALGTSVTLGVYVTSLQTATPTFEILSASMRYELAAPF